MEENNREEKDTRPKQGARELLRRRRNVKQGKERFIRIKMWVNHLLSMMEKDRGKIPDNIGNKILITNNLYITKAYMNSLIQITELSMETPVTLIQELIKELRSKNSTAVVDWTKKNTQFDVRLKESGLVSRVNLWEQAMQNDDIPDRQKEIAARCLYTVDKAREGKRLFKTRIFLTVRAKTGSELTKAERIIYKYLDSIGAEYLPINSNIKNMLRFISLISDYKDKTIKDVKAIVTSEQTLAQMLPNVNSFNGKKGLYCGVNITNNSQFMLDLENITVARNIYVVAPSGVGKTVLALNLASSAVENKWAVCVQDIKGNEFTNFTQGTGGYIVSLRPTASGYINSFRMNKEDTDDDGAEMYFKTRVEFSKRQMMILSGISDTEKLSDLEELLDEFLDYLYTFLAVLSTNRNTWKNTEDLDPFKVYDMFVNWMTPTVQAKYSTVSKKILGELRMSMSRNGNKSYIFNKEFDYAAILRSNTLMFDFGMLESSSSEMIDMTLFKLRFAYMRKLNAEFVAYKYSRGIKVLKILEESQIAVDDRDIMKGYVEEFTLRRAQGQSNVLLGNSVSALTDSTLSKPLIENVKGLFIGKLAPDAMNEVIKRFDLNEQKDLLMSIGSDEEHENTFLFVNNMQPRALTPLIKVVLDKNKKYKLYTPTAVKQVIKS